MKYIYLDGQNIIADAKKITKEMEADEKAVFIYTHKTTPLYAYIGMLAEDGKLAEEYQFKLKICYQKEGLDLTCCQTAGGSKLVKKHAASISRLVELLDGRNCQIIVNDNQRSTLAEVVQQLIYIGYPLTTAEVMLEKEAKDHDKAKRFMACIDGLDSRLNQALAELDEIEIGEGGKESKENEGNEESEETTGDTDNKGNASSTENTGSTGNTGSRQNEENKGNEEKRKILADVKASCEEVRRQIEKARNRQLKIAVAASKKTGKSVIVNGMIREELAPTSLELATPNSCIYKKSPDQKYRLSYNGEQAEADSAEGIRRKVGEEFKKAQENASEGFAIPDMDIEYVSTKSNFEAYTVFDTPGPDAAGTAHREKAWAAMEQSDVAVFAIDYAKHLTDTEEAYLKEIKKKFNEQEKFASLILVINKIDQRYNDANTTKSVIKSIDYIRERLKKIDPCYSDCAIFATSALQYFYALEAEKECGEELRQSKDLYMDLRAISGKHKNVRGQLSFLDGQVGNLRMCNNLENITLEDLKRYSGMPDLLKYIAYIAQTKARDELVNSVAYQIDSQQQKIQAIISRIGNIRRLIEKDDESIKEITGIIDEFKKDIQKILVDEIKQGELERLEELKKKKGVVCSLSIYQDDAKRGGKSEKLGFEDIKEIEEGKTEKSFRQYLDGYGEKGVEAFCEYIKKGSAEQLESQKGEILYSAADRWIEDVVRKSAENVIEDIWKAESNGAIVMCMLNEECTEILNFRIEEVRQCIDVYKGKLKKYDCDYMLPSVPNFSFDNPVKESLSLEFKFQNRESIGKMTEYLSKSLYEKPNLFQRLRENIKYDTWNREKKKTRKIDKDEFDKIFHDANKEIRGVWLEMGMPKCIEEEKKALIGQVVQRIVEISEYFKDTNKSLNENLEYFVTSVDDRKKYQKNIELLEEEEALINEIREMTKDFMEFWDKIVDPESVTEEAV